MGLRAELGHGGIDPVEELADEQPVVGEGRQPHPVGDRAEHGKDVVLGLDRGAERVGPAIPIQLDAQCPSRLRQVLLRSDLPGVGAILEPAREQGVAHVTGVRTQEPGQLGDTEVRVVVVEHAVHVQQEQIDPGGHGANVATAERSTARR